MLRRLFVLALVAVATFWTRPAFACSCPGQRPLEDALPHAEVVFAGEVIAGIGGTDSEMRVDRVYRGQVRSIVVLRGRPPGTPCGGGTPRQGPAVYAGPRELQGRGACGSSLWQPRDVPLPAYAPLPGADDRGGGGWVSAAIAALGAVALPLARSRSTPEERGRRRRDAADLAALRLAG